MAIFSQFLFALLASGQMQSIFRTVLKGVAVWMVTKAHGDPASVDTIVGGLLAVISLAGSFVAHSSQPAATA